MEMLLINHNNNYYNYNYYHYYLKWKSFDFVTLRQRTLLFELLTLNPSLCVDNQWNLVSVFISVCLIHIVNTLNIEPRLILWGDITKKYRSAKDNNYHECFRWYEKNVRNNRGTKVSAKTWLCQKLRKPGIYSFSAITNFKLFKEIVITSQVVEDEWTVDLKFKGTQNTNKLS